MEVIHGYNIISDWKPGQKGLTAKAERGGKKYFIKKYTGTVLATTDGMFDAKTIAQKKKRFESFVEVRTQVIEALRPAAGPGGNLIIPSDAFVDGIHYYEATEFIAGAIPDEELVDFLADLSYDEKLMMMKTAAGALSAVHSAKIIHSDLKLKNILIAKNISGRFVAKLIDFDSSYPEFNKKFIGGDDVYASPELAECLGCESDDEEEVNRLISKLTGKTDIFSLGVIYHYYLTGKFPQPATLSPLMERQKAAKERAKKPVIFYPAFILSQGCEFKIDESIKSINLRALIMDMLNEDPAKRPTAMQVLKRLKESDPTIEAPWPEHRISLDNAKLRAANIVGVRKIIDKDKKYEVFYADSKRELLTKDQMVSKGYAVSLGGGTPPPPPPKPVVGIEKPWPEHAVAWDETLIKNRGYVSVKRTESSGEKGYTLARSGEKGSFYTLDKLMKLKYALKSEGASGGESVSEDTGIESETKVETPVNDEPWPEHSIEFDMDVAKAKGVVCIKRGEKDGKKGYVLTKTSGIHQFILVSMLIVQKIAKKK